MKTCLFIILCVVASRPLAAELLQNAPNRKQMQLLGQWDAIVDPFDVGDKRKFYTFNGPAGANVLQEFNFNNAMKLHVPGDWNTQDERLFWYEGSVWYHKTFIAAPEPDKQYLLYFDAVNYLATVYVNGEQVGQHEGGFTPFQFNVTEVLTAGSNTVVVKVNNRREPDYIPTMSTDWWNYGGITRPVRLIELNATYIDDYQVYYAGHNSIAVKIGLAGEQTHNQQVTLSVPELGINRVFTTNQEGKIYTTINAEPQLWSPDNPHLYNVELTLATTTLHDNIGFRTIEVRGNDILLNGESVFLRGIAIHEEKPFGDGRAWSKEDARTLLGWAKELGCNYVRFAHYPHNENMLRMADELGLMVWAEIPVYWDIQFDNPAVLSKAKQQFGEMLSRDKNRAAVILWSIANETPNTPVRTAFLSELAETVRETDPTRLVTAAINTQTTTANGRLIDEDFAGVVDVIGINSYCGWYYDSPETCATYRWQSAFDKPTIVSEFGAGARQGWHDTDDTVFSEEYQSRVYKNNLVMLENMPDLRGVSPWLLKDFRAARRPLAGVQDYWNRKGLLSEQGIRKQAWYIMRDWYQQKQQAGQ
ncbi:glycoside hydrolase family 2 protein [Alteromonas gilva]|uniref:Beta-glucuronidase n=1 Tax=Alteromonas gilva TaxID=2987522 RepID=A0ABT5KXK7_9ALTE|nr:glycoside hydrolase family 2 TIM barrel-domain containing protein [Alteromonas gilva]MDC8829503.1 glycoside hydrolase family 2 TIM barrel-domain containing protein [Alteromonas gilva]